MEDRNGKYADLRRIYRKKQRSAATCNGDGRLAAGDAVLPVWPIKH
jgi:hypothetical protein